MRFDPGTILVMDRGYIDYEWFVQLTRQGVYFVTRLKDNAAFGVVEEKPVPANSNILRDQIIFFHGQAEPELEFFFRLVEIWDEEKKESIAFLTNHQTFAARTIAAIYKDRWQVELFLECISFCIPLYVIAFQGLTDSNYLIAGILMIGVLSCRHQHPPCAKPMAHSRMLV
jgi:hypothetical protein